MRLRLAMAGAVLTAVVGGAATLHSSGRERVEVIGLRTAIPTAAPMCPWRHPEQDMRAFFPGATEYRTELLALSRYRAQILARLGPSGTLESNALYVHRVLQGGRTVGTVLVRRMAAEHGALELVVAVNPDGTVGGVRIQRQREPAAVSAALSSPEWLSALRGKRADSPFSLGDDVPAVPAAAQPCAAALLRGLRSLLIEYQTASSGATHSPVPTHHTV